MNVLIVGSKGFIGKSIYKYFIKQGYVVWGADVIIDYENSKNYYIIDSSNSDFSFLFRENKYDICVNCSGAASVMDSHNNPMRDYYLNTVNVFKILESIRNFQPSCKFINLSSAAVYGSPAKLPIKEDIEVNPISPYGIHKLQSEKICQEFYEFWGVRSCSLRIFSVYGEGLKKQLFWDLYHKAKADEHIVLYGTGNESRDFIHVNDLCRAIDLIIENSAFESDIINVANGKEIFIKEAAKIFFSFFKDSNRYSFSGNTRIGDPVNWMADISKLKSFGYKANVDIEDGLREYFSWINQF